MTDGDDTGRKKGIRASELQAMFQAMPSFDPVAKLAEQKRESDRQLLEIVTAETKRKVLESQADSATVEMAELLDALVDVAHRQASQLQTLAEDTAVASRAEEQRHRSVMRWTRAGVGLSAVAAGASVAVLLL